MRDRRQDEEDRTLDVAYSGRGYNSDCKDGKGPRRHLPSIDPGNPEHDRDQAWLRWHQSTPLHPGWYWACAPGLWPQIVEVVYQGGKLVAIDKHTRSSPKGYFWTHFAGPVPEPTPPRQLDNQRDALAYNGESYI